MQEIKLGDNLFTGIFEGSLRAAILPGRADYLKGSLAVEAASGGWGVIVNVIEIKHKKLSELTDKESNLACIEDISVAIPNLLQLYSLKLDSDITIITFEFKDALEIPDYVLNGTDSEEF